MPFLINIYINMADKCTWCKYNTKKNKTSYTNRRILRGDTYSWHRQYLSETCNIAHVSECSILCSKCVNKLNTCRQKLMAGKNPSFEPIVKMNMNSQSELQGNVSLRAVTASKTHSQCIICKEKVMKGTCTKLPTEARFEMLIRLRIFSDPECRICFSHLSGNHLADSVQLSCNTENAESSSLDCDQATQLIEQLLALYSEMKRPFSLDFNDPHFTDHDCLVWTGWTRAQFQAMLDCLHSTNNSTNRDQSTALLIFWVKMKTGLSFQQIASLLNQNHENGRRMVSRAFRSILSDLDSHFVPSHIGCTHISRDNAFSQHMTAYSSVLFGGKMCIVWDGTYYYIEKSSSYYFGRHTYSGQKHRPLLKFMSIVFPDGYVLDSIGPYYADGKNNDAGITEHILGLNGDLTEWLQEGDVCVVDRGFRDVIDVYEELGLEARMPSFLKQGIAQHSAEEANQSRIVTKVRWTVEAYHGRLKKWQFFDKVIHHDFLDVIGPLNRIVTAAMNAFRPPLISTDESDAELARDMLRKAEEKRNHLFCRVERGHLSSRGKWTVLDSEEAVPEFPKLTQADLRALTFGTYQLKQAKSYTKEHMSEEGDYDIEVHNQAPGMLRGRIQSRHINAKRYFCWIEYDLSVEPADSIVAWFCQCKTGLRMVGCCAHVTSILWFLGYARHQEGLALRTKTPYIMNAADR